MGATQSCDSVTSIQTPSSLPTMSKVSVPLEVLEEIFLNLPPQQMQERRPSPAQCFQSSPRLALILLLVQEETESSQEPMGRRLGKKRGPCCSADHTFSSQGWPFLFPDEMRGWQILENNGDRWKVENVFVAHPKEGIKSNFVTSYGMCSKSQLIELESEGYNASFMDHIQPDIRISDWYAPRWDCGCQYKIHVELLNKKKKPIQIFSPDEIYFEQWNDGKWKQITHVFHNYGPGVRYIRFVHGGKDTQFWAGWYGIRLTDSCVEICPAMET